MFKFTVGNIVKSETEAIVNTVNTVGIMGKGIALAMKNAFPENYKIYQKACKEGKIDIGRLLVTETGKLFPKYIINFPTKKDWRKPSEYIFIEKGLKDLIKILKDYNINSVSIPPLGSGNGKLNWILIKKMIIDSLIEFDNNFNIIIYEPGFQNQTEIIKKEIKLTPIQAIYLYLLNNYQILSNEINLLVSQKIAYFMQRFGEKMNLEFNKAYYGPYSQRLNYLLKHLNNSFIFYNEQNESPNNEIMINYEKLSEIEKYFNTNITDEQKERTETILQFIEGFESPFGLELLATIDFISNQTNKTEISDIEAELVNWTKRKRDLFKSHHIIVAYDRLKEFNLI